MCRTVYERFQEIIPKRKVADLTAEEIMHDCKIAFEIIGYEPNDLKKAFTKAWETSKAVEVYEFVFDVFLGDSE